MTATSGKQLSAGLRHAVVFELDTNGYPAASGTGAYEGMMVNGPKAYTLTIPDVRKITHVGADRALALDFLPAIEATSGEIRAASQDIDLNAFLSGVKDFDVGETHAMMLGTDQQGYEPQVGLLLFQQSLDTSSKLRNWRLHIVPRARVVPVEPGMDENAAEARYSIAPSPSTKHLWGTALATGTEGATEAGIFVGQSEGKPCIVAFKGNNTDDDFLFPADKPSKAAGKIVIWKNGVKLTITTDYTLTTLVGFHTTAVPASGAMLVVYYEY
jgi:hypothetical protein